MSKKFHVVWRVFKSTRRSIAARTDPCLLLSTCRSEFSAFKDARVAEPGERCRDPGCCMEPILTNICNLQAAILQGCSLLVFCLPLEDADTRRLDLASEALPCLFQRWHAK